MFCPNCGSQMTEGALFCSNCGYKSNTNVGKKFNFIPLIILLLVVIVGVFGVKTIIENRHCKYPECQNEIFKKGYCQKHYAQIVAIDNVEDVLNGKKNYKDAAKEIYDNTLDESQKRQVQEFNNQLKEEANNLIDGLFGK